MTSVYNSIDALGVIYNNAVGITADGTSPLELTFGHDGAFPNSELLLNVITLPASATVMFIAQTYIGGSWVDLPNRLFVQATGYYKLLLDNKAVTGSKFRVKHDVTGAGTYNFHGNVKPTY
jgi:hypothetical protein